MQTLIQLIDAYCSASGQQVNKLKLSVFFRGKRPSGLIRRVGRHSWHGHGCGPESVPRSSCHLGSFEEMWIGICKGKTTGENSRVEAIYLITSWA